MAFASTDDMAARLGRQLTSAERDSAELLLELATGAVAEAAGKSDEWAEALDPVPAVLRGVTLEAVARVLLNPDGLASVSEQLGEYQHSKSFQRSGSAVAGGLALTEREDRLVCRAVNGSRATTRVGSLADDLACARGPVRWLGGEVPGQ